MPSAEFTDTWGAMFIALSVDGILYGIGMILAMQYFNRFSKDAWQLKALIGIMVVLATVHYGTTFAMVYWLIISDYGNEEEMDVMPRTALAQLLAIYLLAFCSQCFFASRIWKISKSYVLLGIVMSVALLQISAGIAQTVAAGLVGVWSKLGSTERITTTQSAATAFCDASITGILIWLLWERRTGIKKTDTLLEKIIIYSFNRGALTTLAAFLNMLLFVLHPSLFIFMIPLLPSGHLYIISVTTTLLFRLSIRQDMSDDVTGQSLPLTGIGFRPEPSARKGTQPGGSNGGTASITGSKSIITWNDAELGPLEDSAVWDRKQTRRFDHPQTISEET